MTPHEISVAQTAGALIAAVRSGVDPDEALHRLYLDDIAQASDAIAAVQDSEAAGWEHTSRAFGELYGGFVAIASSLLSFWDDPNLRDVPGDRVLQGVLLGLAGGQQ